MSSLQQFKAIYENGVLKPLEPLNLAEHQRVRVSVEDEVALGPEAVIEDESFFDAATRLGFIGCIKNTPSDLSTNPKYMEGFGKNGA